MQLRAGRPRPCRLARSFWLFVERTGVRIVPIVDSAAVTASSPCSLAVIVDRRLGLAWLGLGLWPGRDNGTLPGAIDAPCVAAFITAAIVIGVRGRTAMCNTRRLQPNYQCHTPIITQKGCVILHTSHCCAMVCNSARLARMATLEGLLAALSGLRPARAARRRSSSSRAA